MKIYPYWFEKSVTFDFNNKTITKKFFQGSHVSQQDAEKLLNQNLPKLIEGFTSHFGQKNKNRITSFEEYDSDIVEPILDNLSNNQTQAYITRNHYGAEVLCVDNMLILDLDFDSWDGYLSFIYSPIDKFLAFLGIKTQRYLKKEKERNTYLARLKELKEKFSFLKQEVHYISDFLFKIEQYCQKFPDLNFKIYKTNRGLRAIETSRPWNAKSQEVKDIINEFQCDRVYYLFCLRQNCFRARLTPKPWRIKMTRLEASYPFLQEKDKLEYDAWVNLYNVRKENYTPYKYMISIGSGHILMQFKSIVMKHDSYINDHDKLG